MEIIIDHKEWNGVAFTFTQSSKSTLAATPSLTHVTTRRPAMTWNVGLADGRKPNVSPEKNSSPAAYGVAATERLTRLTTSLKIYIYIYYTVFSHVSLKQKDL